MLQNQSVLITGCSTGIGRALAEAFAGAGHMVFATARKPETLADIAGVQRLALDVESAESIRAAVNTAISSAGRIDILVNNAGFGQMGPILDLTPEQVRAQFETNIVGVIAVTQAVAPHMIAAKRGRIVNVGSISGILTTPFSGIYCASKSALHSVSEALRVETAPFGLDVIIVQPGGVKSHFGETAASHVVMKQGSVYERFAKAIEGRARLSQRNATPADVVAKEIVEACTRETPPTVVRVGYGGKLYPMLRRVLPDRRIDAMLRKRFGLDGAV